MRAAGVSVGNGVPSGVNNTKLFHAADWLPTFVGFAYASISGVESEPYPPAKQTWTDLTSGLSATNDAPFPRNHILHSIDPKSNQYGIRLGDFKLPVVQKKTKIKIKFFPPHARDESYRLGPKPGTPARKWSDELVNDTSFLFSISADPGERVNLTITQAMLLSKDSLLTFQQITPFQRSRVGCVTKMETLQLDQLQPVPGLQICTSMHKNPNDPTKGFVPTLCQD